MTEPSHEDHQGHQHAHAHEGHEHTHEHHGHNHPVPQATPEEAAAALGQLQEMQALIGQTKAQLSAATPQADGSDLDQRNLRRMQQEISAAERKLNTLLSQLESGQQGAAPGAPFSKSPPGASFSKSPRGASFSRPPQPPSAQ